jgi:hypothetical protein
MDKNLIDKVKMLVGENRLVEALDSLLNEDPQQNERKKNALLLLKGKLNLLEEQRLAGMLSFDELARQKAAIAHKILDISDGSALDTPPPVHPPQPDVLVQKTATGSKGRPAWRKYAGIGFGLLAAVFFLSKFVGTKQGQEIPARKTEQREQTTSSPSSANETQAASTETQTTLKVHGFPRLKQPFNFLDFGMEFVWADAGWISDTEIRLKIRYYLTCKSNLGVCYRATIRAYADGKPYAPAEQSNLDGWIAKDTTATDDVAFVLPADAKEFHIEFARDHSTWKRPFKILR